MWLIQLKGYRRRLYPKMNYDDTLLYHLFKVNVSYHWSLQHLLPIKVLVPIFFHNASVPQKSSFEVCNLTKTKNYKYVFDEKTRSAYIHGGDRQWLGLENPITMFTKASYIKTYNLAGIMIYDLASDDYKVLLVTPCL